jgi:transposase
MSDQPGTRSVSLTERSWVLSEIFAGLDWGGRQHQLCVIDGCGERLLEVRVSHDRAGLEQMAQQLAVLAPVLPIAVERADGLLVERLLELGHRVYPINPRVAARLRERYRVAPSKDDAFDAWTLADGLRHEQRRWRALQPPSVELAELRALVRDRARIVAEQVRVESQLRAILESYHPAAARLFSSVDRQIALAFVREYPTPQRASRIGVARMERFLARHSYRGRVPAATLVQRLRDNLLQASPGTIAGKQRSALAFADLLELLNRKRDELDRAVSTALAAHHDADIFLSFPGVATLTAAMLLAEIGEDRDRFPEPAMLLAEAGLAPVTRRSGASHRVRFRLAANHHLRQAFTWWAYNSLGCSPWARASYDDARQRGQRSYRALRGLGARWARVLWRCWQDSTPYDATRHGSHATG